MHYNVRYVINIDTLYIGNLYNYSLIASVLQIT